MDVIESRVSVIKNLDGVRGSLHAPSCGPCDARHWQRQVVTRPALRKVACVAAPDVLVRINHHTILRMTIRANRAGDESWTLIGFGLGFRHTLAHSINAR